MLINSKKNPKLIEQIDSNIVKIANKDNPNITIKMIHSDVFA